MRPISATAQIHSAQSLKAAQGKLQNSPNVRHPVAPAYDPRPNAVTPPKQRAEMPVQSLARIRLRHTARATMEKLLAFTLLQKEPRSRFNIFLGLRRWIYLLLVVLTAFGGMLQLWAVLRVDGFAPIEYGLMAVFATLFTWIATSFWLACFGAFACFTRPKVDDLADRTPAGALDTTPSRTALLMPVYNEDARHVCARLQAMCASLEAYGYSRQSGGDVFDIFILSDSNKPQSLQAENYHISQLRQTVGAAFNIYYRNRSENKGRKSGNIADFCENWGSLYDYMVILDADSLMTGATLTKLVAKMSHNPNTALIQVPPSIIGGQSMFARIQQFASSLYGPIYATGLAYLQGGDGNFWGHNAIIRVKAFRDHCGLPTLPGRAPLGGEIMSHDFVEAALLRRAGWDLWMAPDLGGSFEETPPTAIDHLARERRWCQGNIQHLKIVTAAGLKMPSRLHLLNGIMSYVSSPLWLLLLGIMVIDAHRVSQIPSVIYHGAYPLLSWSVSHGQAFVILVSAMVMLLLGPKLLAYIVMLRSRKQTVKHGGALKALQSVISESVFSALFAPVSMLTHSWFVITILMGKTTGWGGQNRTDSQLPLSVIARAFAGHTLFGVAVCATGMMVIPANIWWLLPVITGLIFAVPLVYVSSHPVVGSWARRQGLFLTPPETFGFRIVRDYAALAHEEDPVGEPVPLHKAPATGRLPRRGDGQILYPSVRSEQTA